LPLVTDPLPRYSVVYGGAGSGKSYAIAQRVVVSASTEPTRWLVVRKVGTTLKDSVFQLIRDIVTHEEIPCRINLTDKTFTFPGGGQILCKGLDDPEKIKSIQGITDCWIEEASELKESDFKQLTLRLRGKGIERHFILSFNPIDENHWLKHEFFDQSRECQVIHTTYKDNGFLDPEYKAELESYKDRDPYYYKVYCLGEWGSVSGHRILKNVHVKDFEVDNARRMHFGLDFGYHDPNALIGCYVSDNKLYVCKEWVKNGLDPNDMLAELDGVLWVKGQVITADSARPEIIVMMRNNDYMVHKAKKRISANKVERRYKFAMAQYLIHFDEIIIHPSCVHAAREFTGWQWDEDRDGKPIMIPKDGDDHTVDATIYALERLAEIYYRSKA